MPALVEGTPVYIKGSGAKPYELKNVGGVLSCSCMAWRNQSAPIDKRTCKHLKAHCGDAAEAARISVASKPKVSPGCACEHGSTCDVTHDPATCPCAQCTAAEAAVKQVGTNSGRIQSAGPNASATPRTGGRVSSDDAQRIIDRANSQGRKLRQDEKAKLNGPPVLLAHSFDDFDDLDPTGWWYSEKLDGVRAWWDGKNFISRQGNVFHAPAWFKVGLPDHLLDGELWIDRGKFQNTLSIVRRLDGGEMWKVVKYVVFDAPHLKDKPFEERLEALDQICLDSTSKILKFHHHHKVQSRKHLLEELKSVETLGGEGLMIRKPGSLYEVGRSATILKVKPFKDAEAVVIGHAPGKGRHKGVLGGLLVRMPNGKEFTVGTGLTDAERRSPPQIGQTITYRYTEHTNDGIPKCASYVCTRDYE